jgi:hypothetical protein
VSLSRDSRQEKKLKAIRLAQHRLGQRLQTIDWYEDVLLPEIEALKSGRPVLGLPEGVAFDIQVVDDATPDPPSGGSNPG